jgi:tetratricopeptide (TPR) repeat protein
MGLWALFIQPASIDAQRFLEEPPGKAETRQKFTEESRLVDEGGLQAITRHRTYLFTELDDRLTSKAIVWEQVKESFLDEITALIMERLASDMAPQNRYRVKGIQGSDKESSQESEEIRALIPSSILMQIDEENWGDQKVSLTATAKCSLPLLAQHLSALREKEQLSGEIGGMRLLASEVMTQIEQIQNEAIHAAGDSDREDRYRKAVRRLIAVDWYEKAIYFGFTDQPQLAIDAYTHAIQSLPELAVAYKNRGMLYLSYLKDKPKAVSDINMALQAYSNSARNHRQAKAYGECLDVVATALILNKRYANAYYQRAACLVGLGQQSKAKEDFLAAARLGDRGAQDLLTAKGIVW